MFTAILLGCLAVTAIIIGFGVASDITGAAMPGFLAAPTSSTTTSSTASTTTAEVKNEKSNITPNGETIIGLRDPTLIHTCYRAGTVVQDQLGITTFDTTTYGDRSVVKLTNNGAGAYVLKLTGICIRGKIVSQLAGKNGYVWEYSDYDAIEKEGENYYNLDNDFIFSPSQAKSIGDFVWKELKPHKLYSLMLVGMHYNYEIGDVYHLTLTHAMNGGTMEDIDTDVEVMGTSMSRSVGGVGTTNLNLRVPSSAWALTLARNARLVGAGNSQRLNNRSNVVTVASSTWTGQADYFCDGTSDNVEIQAALDYVKGVGGGQVILTSGPFYTSSTLKPGSNTILSGAGSSTIIYGKVTALIADIVFDTVANSIIQDFVLDGSLVSKCSGGVFSTGSSNIEASRVEVRNYISSATSLSIWALFIEGVISNCYVHDITVSVTNYDAIGIYGTERIQYNVVANILATGGGSGYGYGYAFCRKAQQNKATNCTTAKYFRSYADSAGVAAYACADTDAGGFNS